jgi:hypothetical protein
MWSPMNLRNTLSLGKRILIHADLWIGGWGGMPNFPICTALLETSLLFLVNHFGFFSAVYETKALS